MTIKINVLYCVILVPLEVYMCAMCSKMLTEIKTQATARYLLRSEISTHVAVIHIVLRVYRCQFTLLFAACEVIGLGASLIVYRSLSHSICVFPRRRAAHNLAGNTILQIQYTSSGYGYAHSVIANLAHSKLPEFSFHKF